MLDIEIKPLEEEKKVRWATRLWKAIISNIRYDPDGIFKDPKWPHLWS